MVFSASFASSAPSAFYFLDRMEWRENKKVQRRKALNIKNLIFPRDYSNLREENKAMNKLNEMNIADLSDQELDRLRKYEQELNQVKGGESQEVYLLALKK